MVLAGQAIRAVALGVVVTALVQTVLAGLGLWAAGVPFASLLTGVVLLLCIAQIGPILVLVFSVISLNFVGLILGLIGGFLGYTFKGASVATSNTSGR